MTVSTHSPFTVEWQARMFAKPWYVAGPALESRLCVTSFLPSGVLRGWYAKVQWHNGYLRLHATVSGDLPADVTSDMLIRAARLHVLAPNSAAFVATRSRESLPMCRDWFSNCESVTEAIRVSTVRGQITRDAAVVSTRDMRVEFCTEGAESWTVDEILGRYEAWRQEEPF